MNRRESLQVLAGAVPAVLLPSLPALGELKSWPKMLESPDMSRVGIPEAAMMPLPNGSQVRTTLCNAMFSCCPQIVGESNKPYFHIQLGVMGSEHMLNGFISHTAGGSTEPHTVATLMAVRDEAGRILTREQWLSTQKPGVNEAEALPMWHLPIVVDFHGQVPTWNFLIEQLRLALPKLYERMQSHPQGDNEEQIRQRQGQLANA